MAFSLAKWTAYFINTLTSRRSRIILGLTFVIIAICLFLSRTDDYYHQHTATILYKSSQETNDLDWSRYAYTQYVTSSEYLCISVMLLERLHHLGSRADRVLMYPQKMLPDPETNDGGGFHDAELLIKARDEYDVKLMPVEIQHRDTIDDTWANSYTKLLAFNLTQYERVIAIDADITVLKHMDELFHLPTCPIAMPRAYWLLDDANSRRTLTSHIIVIQPSEREFARIQKRVELADEDEYDMELLNKLYADTAMAIPHRPYAMLSSEFREAKHHLYLGSETEEWDPVAVLSEAKTVHFSDFPVPKPWKVHLSTDDQDNIIKLEPKCKMKGKNDETDDREEDCSGRDVWRELYADFRERKARVCAKKQWVDDENKGYGESKEDLSSFMNPIPSVEPDDDARITPL
ncbi:glycosyltransferase family 8 protein [Trichoderma camerunense]